MEIKVLFICNRILYYFYFIFVFPDIWKLTVKANKIGTSCFSLQIIRFTILGLRFNMEENQLYLPSSGGERLASCVSPPSSLGAVSAAARWYQPMHAWCCYAYTDLCQKQKTNYGPKRPLSEAENSMILGHQSISREISRGKINDVLVQQPCQTTVSQFHN